MTIEHDDATDTRPASPTTRGRGESDDSSDGSGRCRRLTPDVRPSASQVAVVALAVLVAIAGIAAAAPAAAGLASGPSAPSADPGAAASVEAEASGPIGPTARPDISGGFSRPTYTGVAGDPVRIRYTADNPDGNAYLLIGGNRLSDTGKSVGFVDVVKISGAGETTINTRTLGTDDTNVNSCSREDTSCDLSFVDGNGDPIENLSSVRGATGAGELARPLVPQRYRLAITNGTFVVDESGVVTPTESADQADLVLEKPRLREDVEVFTSVDPSALDDDAEADSLDAIRNNGLERTEVTKGNRIVLGFESTGIWGALSHFAAARSAGPIQPGEPVDHRVLSDLLAADEGVSLEVRETNPGRNQQAAKLDLSRADPADVTLIPAEATDLETPDAPGRFYLVIDTSDGDHFTEDVEPGDEFAVEFALEGTEGERYAFADGAEPPAAFNPASATDEDRSAQFPYWEEADSTARAEASFTVRERYLRYDHVTDDGELIVEADDGRLTGTTSLLPVREMSATFVNDAGDAPFRTEAPLEIADGTFTVDADLEDTAPGTRLNYELYEGSTLRDSRTVVVVGDADNPDELVIEDAPGNVTVTAGDNLSAIQATARNAGGLAGEGELTLEVDNESATGSWGVRLEPGASRTYGFESVTADLDPGRYPFTLTLDGDTHTGTVVVEADPATTTLDDEPAANGSADESTANGSTGESAANDSDTSDANDSEPSAGGGSNADTGNGTSEAADMTQDTNASDGGAPNKAPADDGLDSSGLIPLPFGTREAFGGTVLVGAVHLLGHWV